jgi:hypothetical protein
MIFAFPESVSLNPPATIPPIQCVGSISITDFPKRAA